MRIRDVFEDSRFNTSNRFYAAFQRLEGKLPPTSASRCLKSVELGKKLGIPTASWPGVFRPRESRLGLTKATQNQ